MGDRSSVPNHSVSTSPPQRRATPTGGVVAAAFAGTAAAQLPGNAPTAGPIAPGRGSQLTDKVAVVTGAARGIGRSIAVELAANGADVVAIDICGIVSPASNAAPATPEDLAETVRQVKAMGRRALAIQADIRDIGALRAAADDIEGELGKIDIVVANAAIQRWKPLLEMEDTDWRDVIDNNLNGTANTIRAFAPKMVARHSGRIIVLSSMQGKHGTKDASSYAASKWGILGLMKSAAIELGPHGITVNALIPGLVDTSLTRYETRYREAIAETQSNPPEHPTAKQAWDARKVQVPLKVGWLRPEDISPAAVFLASDAAAMVTGAEYEVTGGDSAHNV
ncbi:SDR family NAD(P)-dependent oxidoreductase [Microvirga puerhi]|uniref:SDR family NAD(P)-dependent oxidoreductase n=1 Tax=Microvirga puerhi TaxID=2876078 RepID=A0ABS7VSR4_9HYPH|nr:SDR family NAD(P)-dependent oxidoreductase [Microvirga puerhi]MBZ6078196.1 SDR family NAD(P)-dependent oxidoreductase [Microvirga puerhi]